MSTTPELPHEQIEPPIVEPIYRDEDTGVVHYHANSGQPEEMVEVDNVVFDYTLSALEREATEIDEQQRAEIERIRRELEANLDGMTDSRYMETILNAANTLNAINMARASVGLPPIKQNLWESIGSTDQQQDQVSGQLSLGQELADNLAAEGVPECSIAASDVAKTVYIRMGDINPKYNIQKLSNIEEGGSPEKVHVEWLRGGNVELASGHTARLGLVIDKKPTTKKFLSKEDKEPKNLRLVAVVRDDIVFPLVRFNRTDKDYCDYLQFWGEEQMDELESVNFYGWGSDDNGSRFDAVQSVGSLIKYSSNGKDEAAKHVADALKLSERVEKVLGTTSKAEEEILRSVFFGDIDEQEEYTKEFSDLEVGKVKTNITVKGVLQNIEDNDDRKQLAIKSYPSSQPEGKWKEQIVIIDKRTGITMIDNDGNASEPTDTQVQLIQDLVSQSAHVRLVNSLNKNKSRGIIPDRLSAYSIFFTSGSIGQIATKALLDFGSPMYLTVPNAGVATFFLFAINKIRINNSDENLQHNISRIRGGEEEEM